MPTSAKIRNGVEKWVLREAMRGRLPARVLAREKHPFLAPPMGPRTLGVARDVLSSASFRGQPFFDPAKVTAWLDALGRMTPEGRKPHDPVVFFTLSIAVLHARLGLSS
jgi:asparagine synthase (glutamine-hydrolysing)